MALSARGLNRATLARQLLLRRERLAVEDAVRRVVALQAQSPASPYLALWNRVSGFDAGDLDAAYAEHTVVKASLMRITAHVVTVEDYPSFQHAMVASLRAARLADRRFTNTGLTATDADGVVADVLEYTADPRTNADMEAWLEMRLARPVPRLWWALRHYAPVVHAPTGGPWAFGTRAAYVTAPTRPPHGDPAQSVQRLIRRYLEGFGPATAADIARFTGLRQGVVRTAVEGLAQTLTTLQGPGGSPLYDAPGAPLPDETIEAPPRLLGMWDLTLLAHADRSRVVPEEYRASVIRRNGDVLPALLVDGRVAGVWRPVDGGIEATAFEKLPRHVWAGLGAEADALMAFLADREPLVYRRYGRWWDGLPGAEVRTLPG
jgi:hypothetical protein